MVDQLLIELRRREVRIWAEGERLKYDAPRGALTQDLIALLQLHKAALLERCALVNRSVPTRIPIVDRKLALPLSFAQQRMWFLWKLASESPAYNITSLIKFTGQLNAEALAESLRTICQRHEILRTHFVETPNGVTQVIEENKPLEVPFIELKQRTLEERAEAARQCLLIEAARPFDLSQGAPFEVLVYSLSETVHWLFIKFHHIVADARSFSIFLREFAALYQAIDSGQDCVLEELPIQYADFAAWQRDHFQGALREELLSYWKQQLSGGITPLRLPTDQPRPPVKSMRGGRVSFRLQPAFVARLAEIGRSQHATMFMVLMSAFRILLYRYSGQGDFLIGTPTIWRNPQETEPLIGYFGNTLAWRNPIEATDSFLDVLTRERQTALDSYEHQDVPFEVLVEELAPERALNHSPLFEVMFSYGEREAEEYQLAGLDVEITELETGTAKFDLLLSVQETDEGLGGVIEYDNELFERETIERMAGHLEVLLTGLADRPEGSIGDASLLTHREQQLLLKEWNDTSRPITHTRCLQQLFEAQVEKQPQAVAVYYGSDRISYAELNDEANRLAHRLLKLGVQQEQLVGVCLRRTPRLIAALLGVLKAGATYVPIDPLYPPERTKLILDDSRVEVLVAEQALKEDLSGFARELVLVDAEPMDAPATEEEEQSRQNPATSVEPTNLAYVLYTSGSTGQPKGVMIEHHNAVALLDWAYSIYSPKELASVLAATSVCFDLSIFELFVPLCGGHSVVLAANALEIPSIPARDLITLINTVPSVMYTLLQTRGAAFPASLQVVNLAGERLETHVVDEVYRKTRARKVYDLYGPTEATTYSLYKLRLPQQPPSIGRPISNTCVYVLDQNQMPVPVGVVGELYLAGEGLARGYLNRPELTAEKFIAPRASIITDSRLYRTGDLVRYTKSGEIEYQGRNDDQLKVRGYRIEPGEVKAALLSADGIEDALVTGRKGPDGNLYLVAYVVADLKRYSLQHVKLHLRKLLPEYMIPSVFMQVPAIPLSPNGKVDFSRLVEPKEDDRTFEPDLPESESEQEMVAIWKEVLGVEHVGLHDSFFDLGGHSLTAMRATARVNETFDIDLPLQAIFQYPTVCELAAEVESRPRGQQPSVLSPLRAHLSSEAPLTLLQRHLGFIHYLVRDSSFLNIRNSLRLTGPLNLLAAKQALRVVIERHPILRARFVAHGEQLRQETATALNNHIQFEDLSEMRDETSQQQALAAIYSEAVRPFSIGRGPCSRFVLVRLAEDHHYLVMVLHHIITDEWSLGVLFREFALCYAAFSNDLPSPLKPPAFTFVDYALWEQEALEKRLFDQQFLFWQQYLKPPLARLNFSWQDDSSSIQEQQIETYEVELQPVLCDQLAALARRERTSLFVLLLTALKRLLQQESGGADIRVCTNLAYRHHSGLAEMVGPLTDTLILRTHLPVHVSPLSALRMVRDTFIAACGHQDIPFEETATRLTAESGIQREDLAQVFFLFQDEGPPIPPLPGLDVDEALFPEESNFFKSALHNYDLMLYLYKTTSGIRGQLILRGQLGDGSISTELLNKYKSLLEEIVDDAMPASAFIA